MFYLNFDDQNYLSTVAVDDELTNSSILAQWRQKYMKTICTDSKHFIIIFPSTMSRNLSQRVTRRDSSHLQS